jgi:hypothetical protein
MAVRNRGGLAKPCRGFSFEDGLSALGLEKRATIDVVD